MKTISIYQFVWGLAFIATLCCSNEILAEEKESSLLVDPSLCSKEVLMTFFPQPIVQAVLIKHQVAAGEAEAIAKELSQKNQDIVKLVETKASQMDPNPFKDLSQRDAAIKIFRETLYDVFAGVLKKHGITDEKQIHQFLDDMQEVKGKLFVQCIRKEQPQAVESNK